MANNYFQATMTPDSIHLSPLHLAWLAMTGANCELESDGRYYVFWEECLMEDFDEDLIESALADEEISAAEADLIRKTGFREMMRHILYYNPEVTHLRIEGAWTCSKMRPGEFGGSVGIITRTHHLDMSTGTPYYDKKTGQIALRHCTPVEFESTKPEFF